MGKATIRMLSPHFVRRLALATAGPIGLAAANFALSLILLNYGSPAQFGLFAFIQIIIGFGYGISNALFGSPLMVALNQATEPEPNIAESFFRASFFVSAIASVCVCAIVMASGEPIGTAAVFGLSSWLLWVRWFGRSYANAIHQPGRAAISDATFSIFILAGAVYLVVIDAVSLLNFAVIQAFGSMVATLMFGSRLLQLQAAGALAGPLSPFLSRFRSQGRHALLGVISTEATANAHAYIIALLLGPAAFAPVAAAALIYRPVPLVILSLTQLERPVIARLLSAGNTQSAWSTIRFLRVAVMSVWAGNLLLAWLVVTFALDKIVTGNHDPMTIMIAALFWGGIMGLRCLRSPESALIQANGDFRPLSHVTVISSLITLPTVAALVYTVGAVWSLGGVAVGEIVAAFLTRRLAHSKVPIDASPNL